MSDSTFWFTSEQPPGHRLVELVRGPRDGARIEVGQFVREWVDGDGRYVPNFGDNPDRFFWHPTMGV